MATPYERQIYSDQLAQCQRYYQRILGNAASAWFGMGYSSSTTAVYTYFQIPGSTLRNAPTVSFSGASTFQVLDISTSCAVSAISASTITQNSFFISATVSGATAIHPTVLRDAGSANSYIEISSEL